MVTPYKLLLIIIALFSFSINRLQAQTNQYSLHRYDQIQGLPDEGLRDIFFDKTGCMWIATTSAGVAKYNGKSFISLTATEGLSNNFAFRTAVDKDGTLWVATSNGINHVKNTSIDTFLTSSKNDRSSFFTNIAVDKNGIVYAMGFSGLYKFENGKFIKQDSKPATKVLFSCLGKNNTIYFATDIGIICWNNGIKEVIAKEQNNLPASIFRLVPYGDSALLIGAFDGFYVYNLQTKQCRIITTPKGEHISALGIEKMDNSQYLFSDGASSLYTFDGKFLYPFKSDVKDAIVDIKKDAFGNIWLAGNYLYKLSRNQFITTDTIPITFRYIPNWQYFGNGLSIGFLQNKVAIKQGLSFKQFNVNDNQITAVNYLGGTIYLGMANGSVWKLANEKLQPIVPPHLVNTQGDLVHAFYKDINGDIIVGRNYSAVKIVEKKPAIIVLLVFEDSSHLATYDIASDAKGKIVIANNGGIYQLGNGNVFKKAYPNIAFKNSIKNCAFDRYGRLWFSSDGNGIIDARQNVTYINLKSGLPYTDIRGIYFSTKQDVCWVQHIGGITKINYNQKGVNGLDNIGWDKSGLTSLNARAYFVSDTLFIADNAKFVYASTFNEPAAPIVSFTIVKNVSDSSNFIFKPMLQQQEIVLSKGGGVYTVNVQAINYAEDAKLLYRFHLKGNNIDISGTQDNGVISFGNLQPSTYTLVIQIANNEIALNKSNSYQVTFTIPPFWYQTLAFKIVMALLVIGLFIWITKLLFEGVEKKKRQVLENQKQQVELENKVLRNQLDPHLVFNLLNNVQSNLLDKDNSTAFNKISLYSDILRKSLELSKKPTIALSDEIEYLEMCTQIERTKRDDIVIGFSSKLSGQILESQIPSLLWQPLFENAIKYCDSKSPIINIAFYIEDCYLIGSIQNNMQVGEYNFDATNSGNGIRLVKERVSLLNKVNGKGTADFKVDHTDEYFTATIRLSINYLEA